MNTLDLYIYNYISTTRSVPLTTFFYIITTIFDFSLSFVLVVLSLIVLIYFFRGWIYSAFFGLALSGNALLVLVLKYIFNVARPLDSVAVYFGPSFPSYHSAIATSFFVLLIYIFKDNFSKNIRGIYIVICLSFVFLVSVSRIYLGAHWFSDVVAGVLIGGVATYLSIKIFQRVINRPRITSMLK